MFLLDANVLIYAFRRDLPEHRRAKQWLEENLVGTASGGMLPFTELAFLRITTNARVFGEPCLLDEAVHFLDDLRSSSILTEVQPGPEHRSIFIRLAREHGLTGEHLTDAFVAAAAIESAATLVSADRGFRHFRGLRWTDPLDP
jgi:toxin-antitoxin system PIN domain toxin